MMLYKIMLSLFIFGLVAGALNASGIYSVAVPESGVTISEADVVDFASSSDDGLNFFYIYSGIATAVRVLGGAILACITILPLLSQFGIPAWLGMIIQGPIWLVTVWGLYQFRSGYQTQGMD